MKRARLVAAGAAAVVLCAVAGPGLAGTPARWTIAFAQTGGIAGISDRLTISWDGSAVLSHREGSPLRKTLSPRVRDQLLHFVQNAFALGLKAHYKANMRVDDGIDDSVTFAGRTVRVDEESSPPQALSKALTALSQLASNFKTR